MAKDAFGFNLIYYAGDYTSIKTSVSPFPGYSGLIGTGYKPLWNGNISSMAVNIGQFNGPLLYMYTYDQLNRLTGMDVDSGFNWTTNTWNSTPTSIQDYKERVVYDPNGNITNYLRNGTNTANLTMDSLSYFYNRDVNGKLLNNQLNYIRDEIGGSTAHSSNYPNDIDNQSASNYSYDSIGNLTKDNAEGITNINWSVYGKILEIQKTASGSNPTTDILYSYDASGNRISKKVTDNSGNITYTWYARDAQGNVMSTYTSAGTGGTLTAYPVMLSEQHLYGSNRLGILSRSLDVKSTFTPGTIITFQRGLKNYELSNHLGNVLVTISDKKTGVSINGTTIDNFTADVKNATDYFPGGMQQPGRTFVAGSGYRYGFNGQEISSEISTSGNLYNAEFWEYDSRSVRRWNLDPKPTIGISEYSAFNNNPIWFSDPLGDTLSNPQLVDALKMANGEIKNRLKNNQSFYSDDAKANLNRGVADYLIKNNLSVGDASDFQKATQGYYNGLGTIATMSSNEFNSVDAQIVNNNNLNDKNKIIAAVFFMQRADKNVWSFMGSAWDAALLPASIGLFPEVGSGPRGPMINSGTQQAIVNAGSARVDNILTAAARGNGNFGLGTASYNQAMNAGRAWVGPNYRVASDGSTLVSENGLRTFRPPSFKPKLNKSQANFEWWQNTRSGKPAGNGHLDIKN